MGGSVGRVVAGIATGGTSELIRPVAKAAGVTPAVADPLGTAAAAGTDLVSKTGGGAPNPLAAAPKTPSLSDAAKQAQLDEAKRASMTGPSDITNTGGAKGILTDPNAKYVTGKLLGGA